jgi:phage/plasmid-associated DNA primase
MAKIQKFLFLYGGKGSGKGTILKVFKMLFEGYYSDIDLHKLTGGSEFATSGVKETMLLIDEDSDLYSIKDDTNLLKLTSHEPIMVNNKYQSTYSVTFKGLMVAASNQRFKVRNIDSGITRRGVVAEPTEQKHDYNTYMTLMDKIQFELPQIAQKAIDFFNSKGPGYYENYVPFDMMESTDLFFSFMREHARALGDVCTLKTAAELYRTLFNRLGL